MDSGCSTGRMTLIEKMNWSKVAPDFPRMIPTPLIFPARLPLTREARFCVFALVERGSSTRRMTMIEKVNKGKFDP